MKFLGYEIKKRQSEVIAKHSTSNSGVITDTSHILSALGGLKSDISFTNGNVRNALKFEVLDTGIRFLSNCFTQVQFNVLDNENNEVDHPILESINFPNTLQNRNELLFQWAYYMQCQNVVYQSIKNKSTLNPFDFELINLNPDNIEISKNKKSILELTQEDIRIFYKEQLSDVGYSTNLKTLLNKELLIKYGNGVSMDNVNTYSPFKSIQNEIKNIEVAKKAKYNKLKLSGAVIGTPKMSNSSNEMTTKMTDVVMESNGTTHKTLAEQRLRNSGLYGDDYVKLMTIPMQFNSLTKDLNGLDFEKEVISDYRKIYRNIGIPEDITGLDGKRATYENQVNSLIQLYQNKIQNFADLFASGVNQKKMQGTGLRLKGSYSHLPIFTKVEKEKQECQASDMRMYLELLDNDLITQDEFKQRFKL